MNKRYLHYILSEVIRRPQASQLVTLDIVSNEKGRTKQVIAVKINTFDLQALVRKQTDGMRTTGVLRRVIC